MNKRQAKQEAKLIASSLIRERVEAFGGLMFLYDDFNDDDVVRIREALNDLILDLEISAQHSNERHNKPVNP